jgi:hypothetical protein
MKMEMSDTPLKPVLDMPMQKAASSPNNNISLPLPAGTPRV